MKVKLLPLAIGAAIAMPGVALADGPTVYGKMNVTFESQSEEDSGSITEDGVGVVAQGKLYDADKWVLNSNASRLGVKGSEQINDSLSAIYQAEYGIDVDNGDTVFSQRDIFVGLSGNWGTVQLGKFDTPLKKSQGKVDQFNDMTYGDIGTVVIGENREGNLIQYASPKVADALSFTLAVQPGEEDCPTGTVGQCDDGPADNFSASVVYATDMIYAALAVDDGIDGWDATRLTITGNLDAIELGFLYQTAEESEGAQPTEQDGYVLSAALALGDSNKVRFQYGSSETDVPGAFVSVGNYDALGNASFDTTQIAVGFDHKLSKQTKLFANYIMAESEGSVRGLIDDGVTVFNGTAGADSEVSAIQFGIDHKF